MSKGRRILIKQVIKYFLIIVVSLTALFFGRIIWNLPDTFQYYGFAIGMGIIIISVIFDLISAKDMLPIFTR